MPPPGLSGLWSGWCKIKVEVWLLFKKICKSHHLHSNNCFQPAYHHTIPCHPLFRALRQSWWKTCLHGVLLMVFSWLKRSQHTQHSAGIIPGRPELSNYVVQWLSDVKCTCSCFGHAHPLQSWQKENHAGQMDTVPRKSKFDRHDHSDIAQSVKHDSKKVLPDTGKG